MQELEKILEEIDCRFENLLITDDECRKTALSKHDYEKAKYYKTGIVFTERAMDIVKDIIRKHMNDGWIPVEKYGLPKDEGVYDLTIIDGRGIYDSVRWQFLEGTHLSGTQHYVDGVHYWADNYRGDPINEFLSERVIAWRKKPEPYRPKRSDNHDGE